MPRTHGNREKSIRVYTRGTYLPASTVREALRNQLGVKTDHALECGPSHVDVELIGADDKDFESAPNNNADPISANTKRGSATAGPVNILAESTTAAVIQELFRVSLETWYHAIWLPRCERTIAQERSQGLHQDAKVCRMQAPTHARMHASSSSTTKLPPLPQGSEGCPSPFSFTTDARHCSALSV